MMIASGHSKVQVIDRFLVIKKHTVNASIYRDFQCFATTYCIFELIASTAIFCFFSASFL